MNRLLRKPAIPITTIVVLAIAGFFIYSTCSADAKHPDRGSITFGAPEPPKVKLPPGLESFKTIFADVAEKVVPTVVQVIPTKIDTVMYYNNPLYQFFDEPFANPFDQFFNGTNPHGNNNQRRSPPVEKRQYKQQSLGSGVIVSKDGYILTNNHVVTGASEIEVKTSDGRNFEADIVGSDSLSDVAVIKIREKVKDLPVAYIGDSDKLRPGDWAIAVGNPFSLSSSVTMGIISAINRTTPGSDMKQYQNYIQTDAAINPGNSGGALVNIDGALVGINTLIYTQSGGYMGIGFAIPINMAKKIMEDLIYEGKVSRGWLGVSIQDLDPTTRDAFGLGSDVRGVLIGDVFPGQPADKAGMKRGDIVLSVNGTTVTDPNQLRNLIAAIRPGDKVPVKLLRGGHEMTLEIKLTSRDASDSRIGRSENKASDNETAGAAEKLGIKVGPITDEVRKDLNLNSELAGVVVLDVDPNSEASDAGIVANDIIREIDRQPVQSVKDYKQLTRSLKDGDSVLFLIQRNDNTFFKAFKISK